MSLLGTPVYANPNRPFWEANSGGAGNFASLTVSPGATNLSTPTTISGSTLFAPGLSIEGAAVGGNAAISFDENTGVQDFIIARSGVPLPSLTFLGVNPAGSQNQGVFAWGSVLAPTTVLTYSNVPGGDYLQVGGTLEAQKWASPTGFGASVGSNEIAVGSTSVVVPTTAVTSNSLIFLSHQGPSAAGPGAGAAQGNLTYDPTNIIPGTSFQVELTNSLGVATTAANVNAKFVWWVLN